MKSNLPKDGVMETAVLILVCGSFFLAVIDVDNRPLFADLTKIGLGAYIARSLPNPRK